MRPNLLAPALVSIVILAGCGGDKKGEPSPSPSASASAVIAPLPDAPKGPLSIVLEAKSPIVFSAVEGGVVVVDSARTRLARAAAAADLVDQPMPAGLPSGPGRAVRAAGRLPGSLWLLFEKQGDDGKRAGDPLFRLQRDGWKMLADDWRPAIAAWSKNRILAASTSSGRLKIKVIEPSLPKPPDDLPSVRFADPSCEKSFVLADLIALRTGEVMAAGTCKPDIAAGAGASAKRYVVVRWPALPTAAAPVTSASAARPAASAIEIDAGPTADAAPAPSGPTALVDVLPGVSSELAHQAIHARSASDVHVAALESRAGAPAVSRLFHFDGSTWGAEPPPSGAPVVRGLAAAPDGALWLLGERSIWKKPAGGAWEPVSPPLDGAWEMIDLRVVGDGDVWIAARLRGAAGARDMVLRSRPAGDVIRWE